MTEKLMPLKDSWDWPLLLYVTTVTLRREEKIFWHMTPRKLNALTRAHATVNGGNEEESDQSGLSGPKGYIDQVM